MKVHSPRCHQRRRRRERPERQRRGSHGHCVWIMGVNEAGRIRAEHAREFPGGGQVDLVARREPDQIDALGGARMELSLRVGDQHGTVPALAQPQDRQERLLLAAAPGPGGVDVEAEHSSQSLASFSPT